MTRTTITEKLRGIVIDQLAIDEDEVTLDAKVADDLGADSLDRVELVMCVEEVFGIKIDDDVAETLTTFGSMVDHVVDVLERKKGSAA